MRESAGWAGLLMARPPVAGVPGYRRARGARRVPRQGSRPTAPLPSCRPPGRRAPGGSTSSARGHQGTDRTRLRAQFDAPGLRAVEVLVELAGPITADEQPVGLIRRVAVQEAEVPAG